MKPQTWESVKTEVLNDYVVRRVVSGKKVMVAQIFIAKGGVVPTHQHESEQVTCPLEGLIKLVVDAREFTLRPGDVLVIPSNVPHSAEALENYFGLDIFSPIRTDWLTGQDDYLRR